MALTSAPWLDINPLSVAQFAPEGFNAGLNLRRLHLDETQVGNAAAEAADRMRLSWAQLASENAARGAAQNQAAAEQAAQLDLRKQAIATGLQQWQAEQAEKQKQDQMLDLYRFGELSDRQGSLDLEKKKFDAAQNAKTDLLKETSSLFNELSTTKDPQEQLGVLAKHPNAAQALKSGVLGDFIQKPTPAPASVRLVDEIMKTEQAAKDARSSGDEATAKQLEQRVSLLTEQAKGNETFLGFDDNGKPIFKQGKGVASGATVATQSQAQQKLIRYENTIELMNHLEKMDAKDLGLAGVAGEWVMDRGLAQLMPELANKDRVDSRSALIALREGLSREMTDDRGRFSAADREEIMRALPSNGVFESLPDAQQRMNTVRNILIQRARNYSQAIGQTPPLWTLSADEIKALVQAGKINPDAAVQALMRFH